MSRIATRLVTCPRTGALIRVPAHFLAPPRLRASDIRQHGSLQAALKHKETKQ